MAEDLEQVLSRACSDLHRIGARFALIGGLAVSARTEPRFTRDVDLAVAVADDRAAESLVRGMLGIGYRVLSQLEHEVTHRVATTRLVTPGDAAAVIDLMFASCGIEAEIVAGAEVMSVFAQSSVPVALAEHLIAMKVLARDDTRRPQDRVDLITLLGAASPGQVDRARDAIRLIEARGCHRNKQLSVEFERLLGELRGTA